MSKNDMERAGMVATIKRLLKEAKGAEEYRRSALRSTTSDDRKSEYYIGHSQMLCHAQGRQEALRSVLKECFGIEVKDED